MKTMILGAVFALAATVAQADPIEGVWQTQEDDGAYAHVTIKPCGGAFCGTISRTFKGGAEYKSENIGKKIVIDMVPAGAGKYEGKVWRPSNGKTYIGKIDLSGRAMKLAGCVAGGLICAKQNWKKIN